MLMNKSEHFFVILATNDYLIVILITNDYPFCYSYDK